MAKMMKGAMLPKDKWEKDVPKCPVAGGKYASEFGAEQEYYDREKGLVDYVRKNREKF